MKKDSSPTAVIAWESMITGFHGCGTPIPRKMAERSLLDLNREWNGEIIHFLVPTKEVQS